MRPTHLNIVGRSKFIYNRDIQPVMMEQFSHLIKKLSSGSIIIFNENVKSVDDTDVVVNFLVKKGIPRIDIRLKYGTKTGHSKFRSILQKGLSESFKALSHRPWSSKLRPNDVGAVLELSKTYQPD